MSADNVIFVRKENEEWVVWHDSASNDNPNPNKKDRRFKSEWNALKYAHDLHDECGYVEYGVCRL